MRMVIGIVLGCGQEGVEVGVRPWPKRGTPEFEQLQAEEIEQENRAKAAIHSICRGC